MTTENTENTETTETNNTATETTTEVTAETKAAVVKEPKVKKEKVTRTTPPHIAKIDKVAAQLPVLGEVAGDLVKNASALNTTEICGLIAHLQIEVRRRGVGATALAQGQGRKLTEGMRVKIVSCVHAPRLIGLEGTVSRVQRIRCYVKLDGREYTEKDDGRTGDYFFHSDCKPLGVNVFKLDNAVEETPSEGSETNSAAQPAVDDNWDTEDAQELEVSDAEASQEEEHTVEATGT